MVSVEKNKTKRSRRPFDEWLADARTYRETYGDLLVPNDYVTPEGNRLGRWIERKRAQYNGVKSICGRIYDEEIAALESIGMVWRLEYRFDWDAWMREAALYYDTYGNLNVPKDYVHGDYSLGNWLIEQRKKYAMGELSSVQVRDLERYQICWKLHTPRSWDAWYAIAEKYYESNGNLRVRADYVTDGGDRLGRWICAQRDCYHGRPGKRRLLPEEIEKLEKIGMIWSIRQERDNYWYRMLEYTKRYQSEYNRLPPKTSEKVMTPDGHNLTNWVRAQQDCYRKGLLNEERASALRDAGVIEHRNWKKNMQKQNKENRVMKETGRSKPDVYSRNDIGTRIRKLRTLMRLSPGKAAEALDLTKQNYVDIESGTSDLSLDVAVRMSSYYHVSLEYLFHGRWAVSKPVYTQESVAILFMLKSSQAEKRKRAVKILQAYLAE